MVSYLLQYLGSNKKDARMLEIDLFSLHVLFCQERRGGREGEGRGILQKREFIVFRFPDVGMFT